MKQAIFSIAAPILVLMAWPSRKLWFSDTYVRTAKGWKYVLGQASIALPKE